MAVAVMLGQEPQHSQAEWEERRMDIIIDCVAPRGYCNDGGYWILRQLLNIHLRRRSGQKFINIIVL